MSDSRPAHGAAHAPVPHLIYAAVPGHPLGQRIAALRDFAKPVREIDITFPADLPG